jgi:protein-disulfide isomerase
MCQFTKVPLASSVHFWALRSNRRNSVLYIDTGKVRFVSRDLPLDFHSQAMKAPEAVHCAGDQGKYWEFRDPMFASTDARE